MLGAEEMEGNVRFVSHYPAVVAGPDVEKIAGLHLVIAAVVHPAGGRSGNDEPDVFHFA